MPKQFLLYYFSNEGAKIVAQESKAIIPTQDALTNAKANGVPQATIDLYSVYDGNGAVSGSFAATETVTGVIWSDILYNDLNTKVFNAEKQEHAYRGPSQRMGGQAGDGERSAACENH